MVVEVVLAGGGGMTRLQAKLGRSWHTNRAGVFPIFSTETLDIIGQTVYNIIVNNNRTYKKI